MTKQELAEVFSRRASMFSVLGRHVEALQDAACCLRLDANCSAGYFRMGTSFFALGQFEQAVDTFLLGLRVVPGNAHFKRGYEVAQRELRKSL